MTAERTIEARIRSAARIEPDRLPRLKLLGDAWAEAGASALNDFCASPVKAECLGASPLVFTAGAPEAAGVPLALTLKSGLWPETGLVLGDAATADFFAEAIFGGTGRAPASQPQTGAGRPATLLDRQLAKRGLSVFAEAANPVFLDAAPLDMRTDRLLASSVAEAIDDALAADGRASIALAFRLTLGELATVLRVALPEKALAAHRRRLAVVPEPAAPPADEAWAREIQEGINRTDLELRALLDERQITLGEVACFAVGQTIVLDATMESLIVIECEDQRLFRGRMGMTRDAYMVRIEEKIDPTEEFIDDILAD